MHPILCGHLLISCLEKKLAIMLKTLLGLEAIAKVIFLVKAVSAEKGRLFQSRTLIYRHVYCCMQLLLLASLQTIHCARMTMSLLRSSISLIGNTFDDYQ